MIGGGNSVHCINNGGLHFISCEGCTFVGIEWNGCGFIGNNTAGLKLENSSNITIQDCSFQHSVGQAIVLSNISGTVNINDCKFVNNTNNNGHGATIHYSSGHLLSMFILSKCTFIKNRSTTSIVYIEQQENLFNGTFTLRNVSFTDNEGTNLYLVNQHLSIEGSNSFIRNLAENGSCIYATKQSIIVFTHMSDTTFDHNKAIKNGGTIYLTSSSSATFEGNSKTEFKYNEVSKNGGSIYSDENSTVIFKGSSAVHFSNNKAGCGGALHSIDGDVIFKENTSVTFYGNSAKENGGAVYCNKSRSNLKTLKISSVILNRTISHKAIFFQQKIRNFAVLNNYDVHNISTSGITFRGMSKITFVNNNAPNGGAIYNTLNVILFDENSTVNFTSNKADYGGAIYTENYGSVNFTGSFIPIFTIKENQSSHCNICCNADNPRTEFDDNHAKYNGGAIYLSKSSLTMFVTGSRCTVILSNNKAANGGAVYSESNSNITFKQNSKVQFINNTGLVHGGAIFSKQSKTTFKENSTTLFYSNHAFTNGGSIYSENKSTVITMGYSKVIVSASLAYNGDGGAVYSNDNSKFISKGNSKLTFISNNAVQGGAIYTSINSSIVFDESTTVDFENNLAIPTVLNIYTDSFTAFQGNLISVMKLSSNKVLQNGGAVSVIRNSEIVLKGHAIVRFQNNEAISGGAVYANDESNVTITENTIVSLSQNKAQIGGTIYVATSNVNFNANCSVKFYNNTAWQDGGAIYLDVQSSVTFGYDASIIFHNNSASDYGGAVYSKFSNQSKIKFYATNVIFSDNNAKTAGNSVFINVAVSCNNSCVNEGIVGLSGKGNSLRHHIITTPQKLMLYQTAICIDSDQNETECSSYHIGNIMLGEEVQVGACMYDYYDQPSYDARFEIHGVDNDNYYIPGSKYVLISCNNSFYGIKLLAINTTSPALPFNYSITMTLYADRQSEMKNVAVNLTVELGPCHLGFWYSQISGSCECYNTSDTVLCSGSSSTIKRGYWFGNVTGKPTVTFCPINYCNFTCCETSNGYYSLSSIRKNQCRSHRSGVACGSCEEGYTLSFDSAECVDEKNCTTGMTILVLSLIVLYWILLFAAVFLMMHFKIDIGNFYAVTYYYSVVDLLLSQNWYLSNKLYTTINAISSITKVIPQYLGQFCLIRDMSGIDQQFIHYIHPVAISLFLVIITMLARRSHRLSSFISKGIIRVICCLLLLSYTSLATTLLLLMRPLIFHDVDKVYTYVSPDVEYFHGRHLVYGIVAVLFTIAIVIGLPLLLVLEPFLNSKVNFTKVKPLLDQFQCCYKDNYRCFAAYYMICRLIIITIIIANSSNDFIFQYLLISVCTIMALIHENVKPYHNHFLNVFDGTILHLLVLVSVLPLVEFFDTFDSTLIIGIAFVLVILPITGLITMNLMNNRRRVKRLIGQCYFKCSHFYLWVCSHPRNYNEMDLCDTETSSDNISIIVDDSQRINATVCTV